MTQLPNLLGDDHQKSIMSQHSSSYSTPVHAAVVGAGPVGCLTALSLAARGFSVAIYERRPDPRSHQIGSGSGTKANVSAAGYARSINLAISSRGLQALSSVQVENGETMSDVVLRHSIPMKARMIHTKAPVSSDVKQISQAYGLHGECINSVSRHLLNELLLNEASNHPNISVHFDCKIRSLDLDIRGKDPNAEDECRLNFERWEGAGPTTKYAAFVLGSDGINSIVRSSIARSVPLNFSQEYIDSSYLELHIPPKQKSAPQETSSDASSQESEFALDPNHLHIWPRHSFMLIALANLDKSFTSTLFAPQEILSRLTTRESILSFFQTEFSDALDVLGEDNVVETLLPRKGKGSPLSSIKCYPYHYKSRAIILGDASHAMLPFYGQGLNCGFEDVAFLMNIFDQQGLRGDTSERRKRTASDSGLGTPNHSDGESDESHKVVSVSSFESSFPRDQLPSKLATTFSAYSTKRHRHLLAINQLATNNYKEMSSKVVDPFFLLRKSLDSLLMKTLPKGWWTSLYTMVTFSPSIGYADAKETEERQSRIIERVLISGAVGVAVGVGLFTKWAWTTARYRA
ncbi:unnamed protein product [Sympodiomycopsis kandeliae]